MHIYHYHYYILIITQQNIDRISTVYLWSEYLHNMEFQ